MLRLLPLFAALALSFVSLPAVAQQNPVVVELFTSQGCSSCPPADAMMHNIAQREDVIALAYHVDYWDYIGWKDSFGHPDHAVRQRAYASFAGRRTIYTPEMVVQGQTDIIGAKPMELSEAIAKHARQTPPINLEVARLGNQLTINAEADQAGEMRVYLLHYTPIQSVQIKRGENRGKTLEYANVVSGFTQIADWDGKSPLSLTHDVTEEEPAVVIIQAQTAGPILAAQVAR